MRLVVAFVTAVFCLPPTERELEKLSGTQWNARRVLAHSAKVAVSTSGEQRQRDWRMEKGHRDLLIRVSLSTLPLIVTCPSCTGAAFTPPRLVPRTRMLAEPGALCVCCSGQPVIATSPTPFVPPVESSSTGEGGF